MEQEPKACTCGPTCQLGSQAYGWSPHLCGGFYDVSNSPTYSSWGELAPTPDPDGHRSRQLLAEASQGLRGSRSCWTGTRGHVGS